MNLRTDRSQSGMPKSLRFLKKTGSCGVFPRSGIEWHRLFLFGCRKDADTLEQILPREVFRGIAVSDNTAVYRRFPFAQKCWVHLLRKAIRLTLLYPQKKTYQRFVDELLGIFWSAKVQPA